MTDENTTPDPARLARVLDRVRKLIAKAERTENPAEAKIYQAKADELMLQYQIDEITAEESVPGADRQKPAIVHILIGDYHDAFWDVYFMAEDVARHTRCRLGPTNHYDPQERQYYLKVYGFKADLQYFEILYTSLRLHMLGVLLPKVDPAQSLDENCYRLHSLGYNWLEIAEMYGWQKTSYEPKPGTVVYRHRETGEERTNWQLGSQNKRACGRACKARGETRVVIPAGGTRAYRRSASEGYSTRLAQRLREIESGRLAGSDVILRGRMDDLDTLFRQDNPVREREPYVAPEPCPRCAAAKSGHCRSHPKGPAYRAPTFSRAGYEAGVAHANTAELNPATSNSKSREIR